MALPGLAFEIVRTQPAPGLRSDRTALLTLAERGPEEIPVLVESYDEFVEQFGSPVDGMLGPLLARSYFANGGQDLVVARFMPPSATAAHGILRLAGASTTGVSLTVRARDRGDFGNALTVEVEVTVRKRARAHRTAVTTQLQLETPVLTAADVGLPLRLIGRFMDGVHLFNEAWGVVGAVPDPTAGRVDIGKTVPTSAGAATDPILVEVLARSFTLVISDPGRADIVVPGLDLGKPADLHKQLAATTVTIDDFAPITTPELPHPDDVVSLADGSLAFKDDSTQVEGLANSFRRALQALEVSSLPDVTVAPDLWNRIFRNRGISTLVFDAATAIELGDEMVASAERTRDRVVLLDPPLVQQDTFERPMTVTELEVWRKDRQAQLPDDQRDFVAAYTPWVRIAFSPRYRGDQTLLVPPSLFVAGQMALTARVRGPWNATGNVALEDVVGLDARLTIPDQERLQDVGINPLRMELPSGATIQGVRALAWPDRQPWRFLSTRRLFNFLHRALRPIGQSYVFEGNGPRTWVLLRRDIERLLRDLFNRGGLAGSTPEQAYFVKVDEELNPPDQRDNGVLNAQIAVAPALPLEFLLVRLVVANGIAKITEEPIKS